MGAFSRVETEKGCTPIKWFCCCLSYRVHVLSSVLLIVNYSTLCACARWVCVCVCVCVYVARVFMLVRV